MLESYTTLAFLAGVTERVQLGTLVTGVTYRNPAHLGKIIATLDVVSGGRAICGLGLGWYAEEHAAYGWPFPSTAARYALLEDTLELLPLLWGKGTPAFDGRAHRCSRGVVLPAAAAGARADPRRRQRRAPHAATGGAVRGRVQRDRRSRSRAAQGRRAARALRRRRTATAPRSRSPSSRPRSPAATRQEVATLVDGLRPRRRSAERYATSVNAGTVADQIGRFRELADAGVQTAIVSLPDLPRPPADDPDPVARFAPIIAAFA